MAGSLADDLRMGKLPEWEHPLREAVGRIKWVARGLYDVAMEEADQFDNAFSDGALWSTLVAAARAIEDCLPTTRSKEEGRA